LGEDNKKREDANRGAQKRRHGDGDIPTPGVSPALLPCCLAALG